MERKTSSSGLAELARRDVTSRGEADLWESPKTVHLGRFRLVPQASDTSDAQSLKS